MNECDESSQAPNLTRPSQTTHKKRALHNDKRQTTNDKNNDIDNNETYEG